MLTARPVHELYTPMVNKTPSNYTTKIYYHKIPFYKFAHTSWRYYRAVLYTITINEFHKLYIMGHGRIDNTRKRNTASHWRPYKTWYLNNYISIGDEIRSNKLFSLRQTKLSIHLPRGRLRSAATTGVVKIGRTHHLEVISQCGLSRN